MAIVVELTAIDFTAHLHNQTFPPYFMLRIQQQEKNNVIITRR